MIAMLIVPAATAHLLTDRLHWMVLVSVGLALLSAGLGHVFALSLPNWLGLNPNFIDSTSTSGMMAVAAGLLFAVALFFSPKYGILARRLRLVVSR